MRINFLRKYNKKTFLSKDYLLIKFTVSLVRCLERYFSGRKLPEEDNLKRRKITICFIYKNYNNKIEEKSV